MVFVLHFSSHLKIKNHLGRVFPSYFYRNFKYFLSCIQINLGTGSEQNVNITRYFNPNELKEPPDKKKYLKVFHLDISSLPYHCSELHSLLSACNIDFNVIGITESRIKRNQKALSNIEKPNYKVEQCSTESANGRALLYIKNDTLYKVRNDLKMYKSKKTLNPYLLKLLALTIKIL